jgi:hypothetical protein
MNSPDGTGFRRDALFNGAPLFHMNVRDQHGTIVFHVPIPPNVNHISWCEQAFAAIQDWTSTTGESTVTSYAIERPII